MDSENKSSVVCVGNEQPAGPAMAGANANLCLCQSKWLI